MRMRKFGWDTLESIKEGMVVKFKFRDGSTKTGVVYYLAYVGLSGPIIRCNTEHGQAFAIYSPARSKRVDSFAILSKHSPVAKYGENGTWDFVSNH